MSTRRLAGQLIRLACRSLPEPYRTGRYHEWTAEAAAILDDPGTRPRAYRHVRALLFAADHIRGARRINRQAGLPRTRWRTQAEMVFRLDYVFPLCVLGIAVLSVAWLPWTGPVRVVLFYLVQVAGMTYQIMRERRLWLTGLIEEIENGRERRHNILFCWWLFLWLGLRSMLPVNFLVWLACCCLSTVIVLPSLGRWIFGWPGSAKDLGSRR